MNSFEYTRPATLEEAIGRLAAEWGETEILAGGTDLITCLKQGLVTPKRLVSLAGIESLRGVKVDGGTLRVGAMTTLLDFANDAQVQANFPALVTAVKGIGSPQTMGVGTVGGDLCQRPRCWYFRNGNGLLAMASGRSLVPEGDNRYHAIFHKGGPAYFVNPSSLAPGLIALGATLTIAGPTGVRELPVADLYRAPQAEGERETTLTPAEIITQINIPVSGLRNGTYEVRHRQGLDWPYVTASVAFRLDGGKASDAKVVLGHVAPTPYIAQAAAQALEGQTIDEATAHRAGEAAIQGATPLSRNAYKVQMAKTAVKRAIFAAAG